MRQIRSWLVIVTFLALAAGCADSQGSKVPTTRTPPKEPPGETGSFVPGK